MSKISNGNPAGPYVGQAEAQQARTWPSGPSLSVIWDQLSELEKGYLLARFETDQINLATLPFKDAAEVYRTFEVTYRKGPMLNRISALIRPYLTEEMTIEGEKKIRKQHIAAQQMAIQKIEQQQLANPKPQPVDSANWTGRREFYLKDWVRPNKRWF